MCGIIGLKVKCESNIDKLFSFIDTLTIRGIHCYGIAWFDGFKYKVYKNFDLNIVKDKLKQIYKLGNLIIYHNRYSTSGDWKYMYNNLPYGTDKLGYISFNGVITQQNKLKWKEIYPQIQCVFYNDAQILLRYFDLDEYIFINFVENLLYRYSNWSVASCILKRQRIYGFRNNKRPLYYYNDEELEMFISSIDPIRKYDVQLLKNASIIKPFKYIELTYD